MATCRRTVAGSLSEASIQAARSARETVNPCGRLRSIAVRYAAVAALSASEGRAEDSDGPERMVTAWS
jgi:hypothetical protein